MMRSIHARAPLAPQTRLLPRALIALAAVMAAVGAVGIAGAGLSSGSAMAQAQGAAPTPAGAKPAAAKAKAAKPDGSAPAAVAGSGEAGLKGRVDQLEEQLVDMQVVIGTLESLSKSGAGQGGAPAPRVSSGGNASDSARLDGIETQIRAMTTQLEHLAEQMRTLSAAKAHTDASPAAPVPGAPAASAGGRFGQTTVTTGSNDPIGGVIAAQSSAAASDSPRELAAAGPAGPVVSGAGGAPPQAGGTLANAPAPAAGDQVTAKQLYETAYGYLLQQDYGAAEVAFDEFMKRYPSDALAGNAQYWLGESYFVRGQFKPAAQAFLKGYQSYAQNAKAPDSLLKLAMSLDRLGQKDAACTSYSELGTRFPQAPAHVKSRAVAERQRIGCG